MPRSVIALCLLSFFTYLMQAQSLPNSAASRANQGEELPTLVSNQPVTKELSASDPHEYQFSLAAGEFLHIDVEQVSVDAVVELLGPTGNKLTEVDNPNETLGVETLYWVTEAAGTYRIRVRAYSSKTRAGSYVARLVERRPGTPRDSILIAAAKAEAEADQLRAKKTTESLARAVEKYDEAVTRWREFDDRERVAATLHKQVRALVAAERVPEALAPALKALETQIEVHGKDGTPILPALFVLADLYQRQSDFVKAQEQNERALGILEKNNAASSPQASDAFFGISRALLARKDAGAALAAYEKGLKIVEKNRGAQSLAYLDALIGMIRIYDELGRRDDARDLLRRVTDALAKQNGELTRELSRVLYAAAKAAADRDDHATAQSVYERLAGIYLALNGANSSAEAGALNGVGDALSALEKHSDARAAYERALKIYLVLYKEDHLTVANQLYLIARESNSEGRYDDALKAAERAEKIYERKKGPESETVANLLVFKAKIYGGLNARESVLAAYERAIKIYEKTDGPKSLAVASALTSVADVYSAKGDYPAARARRERAIAIYEEKEGPEGRSIGYLLEVTSDDLSVEAAAAAARPVLERAARIYEKHYGPDYYRLGYVLRDLSGILLAQNDLINAKLKANGAVRILEKHFPSSNSVASALTFNFLISYMLGDDAGAQQAAERALAIYDKQPEPDYETMVGLFGEYGIYLAGKGDLNKARQMLDRSMDIGTQKFGSAHAVMIQPHSNLAVLLAIQGDGVAAMAHLELALKIADTTVEAGSPQLVSTLQNLALIYQERDAVKALELIGRAEVIARKILGVDHFRMGFILLTKAHILVNQDDLVGAEKLIEESLKIFGKNQNVDYFGAVQALNLKSTVKRRQGNTTAARTSLEEALRLLENTQSLGAFIAVPILNDLGWLEMSQGNFPESRSAFLKAANLTNSHIKNTLWALSFAEQKTFLNQELPQQVSGALSSFRMGGQLEKAYEIVFRWKGELVHALRRQTTIARLANSEINKASIAKLQSLKNQIIGLRYQGDAIAPEEWQRRNDALTREKEAIERELGRALPPGDLEDPLAGGIKEFQKLLRSDEVFVDIYKYDVKCQCGDEYYAAIITGPAGLPVLVDLGSAKVVNRAVFLWLDDTLSGRRADASWQSLAALLWAPLTKSLPAGAHKVWLSPEADLSRIPWHLLPSSFERERGLLLSQTDSAREVARLRRTPMTTGMEGKTVLLAGNVDFNAGATPKTTSSGRSFKPLSETALEARALQDMALRLKANVLLLTGSAADKKSIRQKLPSASYVHLATHGFFFRGMMNSRPENSLFLQSSSNLDAAVRNSGRNPLVESGIALAGANVRSLDMTEGLLTAEEITGLDLSKCELLTLSACETGRGEEVTGQGIMGLRASVMAAGSRSMLMSLWKVPDRSALKFMDAFYSNLWVKKMPKAEALLRAQEQVRDDASGLYKEPIHWAAWVLVGEGW